VLALPIILLAVGDFPPADPVLQVLIDESLAARPELEQAEETLSADREAAERASALPDPVFTFGIQNDGFDRIAIGEEETSFLSFALSQSFPWPGKLALRGSIADLEIEAARARLSRLRITAEADVRRTYLDLLLARDRLALLTKLEELWGQSLRLAQARYEAGEGAQSDVLRAQLELIRLRVRRATLTAEEQTSIERLNRLRNHPSGDPIEGSTGLKDLRDPTLAGAENAADRSPERALARVAIEEAERRVDLARKDLLPDIGLSAAVMPRGGMEPMWAASVSINLPLFAGQKQNRAIAESEIRTRAEAKGLETIEQILKLRVEERKSAFGALLETAQLYREGLLVQSEATAQSTVSQYQVGRVSFASVLESLAGYLADQDNFLATIVQLHRVAIADGELSLEPVLIGGGSMAATPVPGSGASGGGQMPEASASSPAEAQSAAPRGMSGM
jgi:outer membrane protein, heavy metal efflux system